MLPLSIKDYVQSTHDLYLKTLKKYNVMDIRLRYILLGSCIIDAEDIYILTLDDDPKMRYHGIRCINARDWLLGIVQ